MSTTSDDTETNVNPLYLWPPLARYRASRHQNPKWPEDVDEAFMDALLLIPPLGKKEAAFQGQRCGQNGLILYYIALRLPGIANIDRKQISHHKTYIKQRIKDHPLFHFFFPEDFEEHTSTQRPGQLSVLQALSENRLPRQQPNYEYFASLVEGGQEIYVRPLSCSFDLRLTNDDEPKIVFHQFTSSLSQTLSRSLGSFVGTWSYKFPFLGESLQSLLLDHLDQRQSIFRQIAGPVDIIHLNVELTLAPANKFLPQLYFGSDIGIEICASNLKMHQWSCTTRFQMPWELGHLMQADPWTVPCQVGHHETESILQLPIPSQTWYSVLLYLSEKTETRAHLLESMAMCQELWSTPSYDTGSYWSRRAVIIWTFSPTATKKGTAWRFLSRTDPSSLHHQQLIYASSPSHQQSNFTNPPVFNFLQ